MAENIFIYNLFKFLWNMAIIITINNNISVTFNNVKFSNNPTNGITISPSSNGLKIFKSGDGILSGSEYGWSLIWFSAQAVFLIEVIVSLISKLLAMCSPLLASRYVIKLSQCIVLKISSKGNI